MAKATSFLRRRRPALYEVPTPTAGVPYPTCANGCNEINVAQVSCVTSADVKNCFCTNLSWPEACQNACVIPSDRASIADWYWGLCPSAMDSRLGSYGTAKSLSSLVQTPEAWAVVSSYTAAFHTGYDCYNAGKCGVPIVTPQASTAPSPSQSATQASKPSLNGMQIIVLVVCLLAFVAGLVLVLCYLYSKKPTVVGRRTGQRDDDSQEVMLTLLVHFMTQQGQQLDQVVSQTGRLNGQMERTNTTLDSLDQTMRNMLDRLATNHPADANPIVQPPPPMAELGSHTPPSRPAAPATPPAELSNSPIPRAAIEKPSWVQTLEAELTCPICSDIFLNPVVLMTRSTSAAIRNRTATGGGCLHTLCGHCAVQALRRDPRCPSCRDRVSGVQDHRQIRQIAEAFLSRYPEQRRSVEEVQAAERLYRRGQNIRIGGVV